MALHKCVPLILAFFAICSLSVIGEDSSLEQYVPLYMWYNEQSTDHFYTTDPSGELAPSIGYTSEGMTGYIATSQLPGTTALYRWNNAQVGDHFYTTDPSGELAPSIGYTSEGITGYIATYKLPGTTALYRWNNAQVGDHFYTTDSSGKPALSSGYTSEGITGFIWISKPVEEQSVSDETENNKPSIDSIPQTKIDSDKCSKAGGYWKLIDGDIVTILKNYPPEEYTGNFIDTYHWYGGFKDDLSGEIKVTYDSKNKWDDKKEVYTEYTVKWDAPPIILYPGFELNIPLSIDASRSWNCPESYWRGGVDLWWCCGFDSSLEPIGTEAYGGAGSSFYFPKPSFNMPGPFSDTRTFHWHGDRVNQCDPMSHKGPESMDGVQSIGFGEEGQKNGLKMRLPSGPVIMYTYSWVKNCDASQEETDASEIYSYETGEISSIIPESDSELVDNEDSLNHAPTVDLRYSPEMPVDQDVVTLFAEADDADGDDLTYTWFIGEIEISYMTGNDPVMKKQLEAGDYDYSVVVSDGRGGEAKDTVHFAVKNK